MSIRRLRQLSLAALIGLGSVSVGACAEQPAPKKQKKKKKADKKAEDGKASAKDGKAGGANEKAE